MRDELRSPIVVLFIALLLLLTGVGLGGCSGGDGGVEVEGEAAELSPEELGELGARLDQEPERAEELLDEAGLDWESFEAAVRRVSADADQARAYSEAFAAAGGETPATAGADES